MDGRGYYTVASERASALIALEDVVVLVPCFGFGDHALYGSCKTVKGNKINCTIRLLLQRKFMPIPFCSIFLVSDWRLKLLCNRASFSPCLPSSRLSFSPSLDPTAH